MTNWMPRKLGSMMLRPGMAYIGATASNNPVKLVPFIFSSTDTAICEITNSLMRVWVSDSLVTRATVTAAITNGTFDSNLTGWTDNDEAGGTSAWLTGGYMNLTGNGTAAAIREQQVTVNEASTEHALDIVIDQGPVTLRVGSTTGDDDYIAQTSLGTGSHSLTLTPSGNFFIEFSSRLKRAVQVDSVAIGSAGTMTITAPWASADLSKIRWDQSADVVYIACDGYQQYKIERRSTTSWSVVKYEPEDGPFGTINTGPITITPSALSSSATLTASAKLFKSTDVGSLFRLTSSGQTVTVTNIAAQDTWTNTIKVTGVTSQRIFTMTREDRTDSTITLQRSLTSDTGPGEDVTAYTTNATIRYDDTLDNQTAWYRIGVATGDYGTDAIDLTLDYPIGSIDGICRIKTYTNATTVVADVIEDFGGTDATDDWYAGDWSTRLGYPTAVALAEGRLGWSGRDKVWMSVSDAYESFDDSTIGDSGPIRRTIGSGPVDNVNWMLSLRRFVLGTDSAEWALRTSSEDEPITPTNAVPKTFGTQGSATVAPVKADASGIFIQQGGTRVMQVAYNLTSEYETTDLTMLYPEVGNSQIARMAIQRQPDTRVHCIRNDGLAGILVHDPLENITCWTMHETGDGSERIGGWGENIASITVAGTTVTNITYSTNTFTQTEFISTQEGFFIKEDGTKMFALGTNTGPITHDVYQYTLSTPYDISSASYDSVTFDYNPEMNEAADIAFSSDGTKMYIMDSSTAVDVYQYTLTSAWDISTASYASKTFDFTGEATLGTSISWNTDGTRLILLGDPTTNPTLWQYTASTAWDVSSLSYDSVTLDAPEAVAVVVGGAFNTAGTRYYILGSGGGAGAVIYRYTASTAFDISTFTYEGVDDVSDEIAAAPGDLYVARSSNSTYYQYVQTVTTTEGETTYTDNSDYSSTTASFSTMLIEDIVIMPGGDGVPEDRVYYVVNRQVDGNTVRYIEKWALESECQGGTINKCVDAHVLGTITDGTMTGLTHLEGLEVSVWVNGKDIGVATVASGQITGLSEDGSNACVGIPYTARFKSTKLGELTEQKNVTRLGVILHNSHYQGLLYGADFSGGNLDPLPLIEDGTETSSDTVHTHYDKRSFTLDGVWDTDSRLCLQAASPRPITLLAAIIETEG
jgi:hypothetical protein